MLTANLLGSRVDAATSVKGPMFTCPECQREVTLKQGRIKIAHFAHKPPTNCSWASGETQAHMEAKTVLRNAYRAMGFAADYEVEVLSSGGDRRADVLVRSPDGRQTWAIEVQHTPIDFACMERRTMAYMAARLPVIWIGLLSAKMLKDAEPIQGGLVLRQYSIRPWEKYAQALTYKALWFIDPDQELLWLGRFTPHMIHKESTSWYSEGGEEHYAGGYSRHSVKWRTLTLTGPYRIDQVSLRTQWRKEFQTRDFKLPSGSIAVMTAD